MSLSCSCRSKTITNCVAETTEVYSLTILEAGSLKLRHWEGCDVTREARGILPCPLQVLVAPGAPCCPWLVGVSLPSLSLPSDCRLLLCLCL